ncbi:T9SS type A sorting domain-containing protein [Fibrella arboris]|uniref:T9SS type A sorting domain-containing protein n=1 Tax=Fibrella arboris TaxID=3242486 RepID=UPI0035221C6E
MTTTNTCGTTSSAFIVYIPYSYRIGPNPAKESITVAFTDTKYQEALPDQIDVISEKTQKPVRSVNVAETFKQNKFKDGNAIEFDVQDLPRGTYYLKVINPRLEKEKQIEMARLYLE